jgi:glutathione S-transferase
MIEFYLWTTPNEHKVTMFLEETGLRYRIIPAPARARSSPFRAFWQATTALSPTACTRIASAFSRADSVQ